MRLTVKETADRMGVPPQLLRMGLQQGKFPFGVAVKMKRWAYYINRAAFDRWIKGEGKEATRL